MNAVIATAIATIGLIASIALEHILIGRRWARYEYTRRAMGVCTVFVWLSILATHGVIEVGAVLLAFFAFGVAGATLGLMLTAERARTNENARRDLDNGRAT